MNDIKYTSKHMKHMELNAIEYVGPALLSLCRSFSLVTAHAQVSTQRMHRSLRARPHVLACASPKRVAARAPYPVPRRMHPTSNEWPHTLPCATPHKGPLRASPDYNYAHRFFSSSSRVPGLVCPDGCQNQALP
jgi:hypothetical protein